MKTTRRQLGERPVSVVVWARVRLAHASSTAKTPSRGNSQDGFVLLEIVIAIALFSMVAVSMVQALDAIAKTSKAAKSEGQVMRVMESVLAEVVHQPKLKPGGEHFEPGADGVEVQATIEKIKLITRNKAELSKMYRIHVDAWVPDGRAKTFRREMETYVYSPNSPDK
jgi:prepilin-type N-terminal cleavage/methylation domain-containing protein